MQKPWMELSLSGQGDRRKSNGQGGGNKFQDERWSPGTCSRVSTSVRFEKCLLDLTAGKPWMTGA